MKLSEIKIIIVTFNHDEVPEGAHRYLAQTQDYPVRNGTGNSVDEAVEDLFLQIIMHLHKLRTGRRL